MSEKIQRGAKRQTTINQDDSYNEKGVFGLHGRETALS
jgi:hypothetical protein